VTAIEETFGAFCSWLGYNVIGHLVAPTSFPYPVGVIEEISWTPWLVMCICGIPSGCWWCKLWSFCYW